MTCTSFFLAAAIVAWGSVSAPPPSSSVEAAETSPPAAVESPAPPPAPRAIAVKQLFDEPALVVMPARRSQPRPEPSRPKRAPLYRDWRFWAISGSVFAACVVATILVTRPGPQPFAGNVPPNVISLP